VQVLDGSDKVLSHDRTTHIDKDESYSALVRETGKFIIDFI